LNEQDEEGRLKGREIKQVKLLKNSLKKNSGIGNKARKGK